MRKESRPTVPAPTDDEILAFEREIALYGEERARIRQIGRKLPPADGKPSPWENVT